MKSILGSVCMTLALMVGTLNAAEPAQFPPGPCEFSEADPLAAAQKCKVLADGGNVDAAFQFGIMLLNFAPQPGQASRDEMEKWRSVGTMFDGTKYITAAAKGGHQAAMEGKCRMASDKLAPADLRREGEEYCAKLKQ